MRVYFAPCGIGLGHVGRCIPIARKLLEKKAEVVFSTYKEGIQYVEQQKLPLIRAPPIGFQVKPDGTIDFRQTAVNPGPFLSIFTFLKQLTAELRTIQRFNPDIVVSDSRISSLLAAKILRLPRICILNQFQALIPRRTRLLRLARLADSITLTIIGKVWTSGDATLIPDFPKPYTVCAGNLNIPKSYRKKVRLIGPLLPVRPEELSTREQLRKKLRLSANKPVIFAPISGPIREKAFLTQVMSKILLEFPHNYEVIMSLGDPQAKRKPIVSGNVSIYDWVPNRFEYLKACDLVIGRAGHGTLTQCFCYGKPMILIPTPNHTEQIVNAKQVADLGAAKIIQQEKLSREKLAATVQQVLKSQIPQRLEEIQKEVLKYDGLEQAVQTIVETADNRPAS